MTDQAAVGAQQFKCKQCGARLEFAPGTDSLECPYCGMRNEIPKPAGRVEELDFDAAIAKAGGAAEQHEVLVVKCRECAAESTLPDNVTSAPCAFCGSSLVTTAESRKAIKPGAVLPFHVTREQAQAIFTKWIAGLWFAPNDVKKLARLEGSLTGVYVPYWTYDCDTTTDYAGERGDYYYTTETYTEMVNGQSQTRTRQVRHTRWSPAHGRVANDFDDVLVRATSSLPPKYLDELEPWDLPALVPYRDEYLSGFRTDSYQVDLEQGFVRAREIMEPTIVGTIRRDIGGDEQRIHRKDTRYLDVTFKHVLFPVWISAYRYRAKIYRLLVNARTGETQGERPYSVMKIVLLVLAVAAAVVTIALVAHSHGR
jgi:DNA-directed RNA polymerase subunit RPC12/RpoP